MVSFKQISPLSISIGLASLGQFFLIQQDQSWTVWVGFLFYAIGIFFLFQSLQVLPGRSPLPPLSLRTEFIFVALIFSLALFFRLYRLHQFPPGLFADMAKQGYGAMRILHEGWNPFKEQDLYLGGSMAAFMYWLALFFKFLGPSYFHILLTSVFVSLLAFPFIYWSFRQLAGPRVALLSLFFLAVMRWHVTYSRDGHPAVDCQLHVFGALSFWLWALQSGKKWALLISFLFLAGGCYAYEGFLPFLLAIVFYGIYEYRQNRKAFIEKLYPLLAGGTLFLLFTWPVWKLHLQRNTFGAVPSSLSFAGEIQHQGLDYLWRHLLETLLMFNRQGDSWFFNNIPYHRMLDDVTGILLILGVAFGCMRLKERKCFYGIVGWALLLLPSFLSINAAHASRSFGSTPFSAFLAALIFENILAKISSAHLPKKPWLSSFPLAVVLVLCVLQNYYVYFGVQAKAWNSWKGYGWEATIAGEKIQKYGDHGEFYLTSSIFNNNAILFLDYFQSSHIHPLQLPESLDLSTLPPDRDVYFLLNMAQKGVLHMLQSLYPGGEIDKTFDPDGNVLLYSYRVPAGEAVRGRAIAKKFFKNNFGLMGEYHQSLDWNSPIVTTHDDPLINFAFRNDFALMNFPPLSVHWKGCLVIPQTSRYRFLTLATDPTAVKVDGQPVLFRENTESNGIYLKKGNHRLDLFFQKASGTDTALNLLWKDTNDSNYTVVPYSAFRGNP